MKTIHLTAALGLLAFAGGANAHDFALGDLTIAHPFAIVTAAAAKTGAGYMTISNGGAEPDRLLEVRADFPATQIHVTNVDDQGVARMLPVEAVEVPPGGSVTLAPRGMHVMFMGLSAPFQAGERIDATLVFEKAGEIAVQFAVETREEATTDDGAMDHGAMGDAEMDHGAMGN